MHHLKFIYSKLIRGFWVRFASHKKCQPNLRYSKAKRFAAARSRRATCSGAGTLLQESQACRLVDRCYRRKQATIRSIERTAPIGRIRNLPRIVSESYAQLLVRLADQHLPHPLPAVEKLARQPSGPFWVRGEYREPKRQISEPQLATL